MADIQEQLKQAINFIKLGQTRTAVKLLTSVIQQDKANPNAWFLLANALTERDQQIKALENALKIDPGYTRAQTMLDKLRPPAPKPSAVSASPFVVDESFADEDNFEDPQQVFSEYEYEEDDPFDEFDEFDEPVAIDSDVDPRLLEAVDLIQDGDDKGAEMLARQVIREDKSNVEAWWILANAIDDEDKRLKALEKVIALEPSHTEAVEWRDEILGDVFDQDDPFSDLEDVDDDPFSDDSSFLDEYDFDDSDDPFADIKDGAAPDKSVKSGNEERIPLLFEIISFIIMVAVGVGGAFGLQMLTEEQTIFGAQGVDAASSTMSVGAGDVVFGDSFNSFNADCRQDLNVDDLTIRTDLDFDDAVIRGAITRGQTMSGYRYELYDDAYLYTANGGETVTVLLSTTTQSYDPKIAVFTPDAAELVSVDRGYDGDDERLQVTFPEAGEYFILVQAFGFGCGDYLVSVE